MLDRRHVAFRCCIKKYRRQKSLASDDDQGIEESVSLQAITYSRYFDILRTLSNKFNISLTSSGERHFTHEPSTLGPRTIDTSHTSSFQIRRLIKRISAVMHSVTLYGIEVPNTTKNLNGKFGHDSHGLIVSIPV